MPFADFDAIKSKITMERAMNLLGFQLPQKTAIKWKGACPKCKVPDCMTITEGKGWFCFAAHCGGDQIALAAHVHDLDPKKDAGKAGQILAEAAGIVPGKSTVPSTRKSTVPENESGKEATQGFQPLPYLEAVHPAVDAIGFDPEFAKTVGIGYAGKGILRGTVAIPVRDENGILLGYIGIQEAKLPPSFTTNVVAFPKTA